ELITGRRDACSCGPRRQRIRIRYFHDRSAVSVSLHIRQPEDGGAKVAAHLHSRLLLLFFGLTRRSLILGQRRRSVPTILCRRHTRCQLIKSARIAPGSDAVDSNVCPTNVSATTYAKPIALSCPYFIIFIFNELFTVA